MDNNFVYIDLIDRFLKGGASPEEEKDLLDWFRKTAPEEVLYAYYRSYWDNAHGKSIPADVQGRMFHQIKLRMKEMEQKRKNIRKLRLWWASTAAAVVALCEYRYFGSLFPSSESNVTTDVCCFCRKRSTF